MDFLQSDLKKVFMALNYFTGCNVLIIIANRPIPVS